MRKVYKIFALFLAVCLILGIAVVAASAISSEEDIAANTIAQLKPNGAYNYFSVANAEEELSLATSLKPKRSSSEIVKLENGNKYMSMHFLSGDTFNNAKGGYRELKFPGTSKIVSAYGNVFNNKIQQKASVLDFDIMPDRYTYVTTGDGGEKEYKTYTPAQLAEAGLKPDSEGVDISYAQDGIFRLSTRYWMEELTSNTDTLSTDGASATIDIYLLKDDDGKWYYSDASEKASANHLVEVSGVGTFDHITMITYPELVYDGDAVKCATLSVVAYVNGEIVLDKCVIASGKGAKSITCDAFRLIISASTKQSDCYSYGIDNYTANFYGADDTSEGYGIHDLVSQKNFKNYSIFDCIDAVGSKTYISPNGYFQVQNPSGNREIVSFPYVVEQEMESIEDGATVLTTMDIDSLKLPEDVNNVNIKCDNQKVKVTLSDELTKRGLEITKTNDGYSVALSDNIPEGVAVIEWKTHDGKILKTTTHSVGDSVDVPSECVPYETAHDWYVERYSWENVASAAQGKTVVKANKEYIGRIQGILQNATLFTDMTYNLYLPVSDEVSNVSVEGAILSENITVGEGKYYRISATPEVDDFAPIDATVKFKVGDTELEYDVALDIIKYASKVSEKYECGSEEATLVYELLAFKGAVALYLDSNFEPDTSYSNYLNSHKDCECTSSGKEFKSSELSVDYEDLKKQGVTAIAYELNVSTMDFIIYVNDGVVIDSVSYTDPLGNVITHTESAENLEKIGNYYLVKNISAAYIANVMTIKVGNVSGTYSLAKYIQDSTNDAGKNVANALYKYSKAAFEYKNITVSEHKFSVSFDTDGGDPMASIKVYGGQTVPAPKTPTKLAFKFIEWQLNGEKYDFSTPVTDDITLKAVWERAEDNEVYDRMQSVLLIGQSNMVGVGLESTVEPIEDDRLFMMRDNQWVKMEEPLHTGSSRYGIGLGASFGKGFVDSFGCDVGLIPAARGSTTLEDWAVGGQLYNNAVRLAKLAQETSDIAAILWHQGEGDSQNEKYAEQLRVILDSMLEELGLDPNKIVIITGELFGTRSDAVHMGQLIELGQYYKNYGIALSDGLTVLDVTTHFDAPSLRVFGYRYFAIFYKLITGKTFEYDDNPENYWSSQITDGEYINLPFDDMLIGNACTGYAGSGYIIVSGERGVAQIIKPENETDKYLSANNFVGEKVYDSVCVDSQNNAAELSYGSVVVLEAKIRLGEGHNRAANIFEVHTENSTAVYSNFYLDKDGNLAVVDADGNKTNKITLNTTDWVSIKVILDTERNLKDIYINDEIVLRGVKISNSVNTAELVIDSTRLVGFESDASDSIGSVQFDDYRFYPYFDNLQPAE